MIIDQIICSDVTDYLQTLPDNHVQCAVTSPPYWGLRDYGVEGQPYPEAHFATFPEKLVEPCILAGSPVGGIVLDPFMGSGTTALVALKHRRHFLGCEINADYVELANRRLSEVQVRLL